ncbi:hypothetical protein [Gymnodinialimonas sp.]
MTKTFSILTLALALPLLAPTAAQACWSADCPTHEEMAAMVAPQSNRVIDIAAAPPVIARVPMILAVLPETGSCFVEPLAPPAPCPRVQLPDGSMQDALIFGFHRAGPLSIEVDQLTFDWSRGNLLRPFTPTFEYTGEAEHEVWSREEWGPCDMDACTPRRSSPTHPAFAIPRPEEIARDFIVVEVVSDEGLCASFAMPEGQVYPCHEVRLPDGEVIPLDLGAHARFPVAPVLYFQRIIHAAAHPLFDYDRYTFIAYEWPEE